MTDITSNPVHLVKPDGSHGGHWCRKISPGCANCYAEAQNNSGFFSFASHLKYSGEVPKNLILDEEVLQGWLKLGKPHKIFVCSMTDMFGEWVPFEWIDKIFAYMKMADWHTFQILTKRPERMLEYFNDYRNDLGSSHSIVNWRGGGLAVDLRKAFPLPNCWIGTTVENQEMADKRIPLLLQIPAAIRWLSVEPLLEDVDLGLLGTIPKDISASYTDVAVMISWVVVGGESGGARACNIGHIGSIVRQCKEAGIPVFVKQLGSYPFHAPVEREPSHRYPYKISDRKGGKIEEFPEYLKIRQFPQ